MRKRPESKMSRIQRELNDANAWLTDLHKVHADAVIRAERAEDEVLRLQKDLAGYPRLKWQHGLLVEHCEKQAVALAHALNSKTTPAPSMPIQAYRPSSRFSIFLARVAAFFMGVFR
jgi:hypothetical protein